jgi:hypothetical protein
MVDPDTQMKAVDPGTFAYFGVGVALGYLRVPWWIVIAGALGWELLERPLRRKMPKVFTHSEQDTAANAVVDVSALLFGSVLARWIVKHRMVRGG